MALTLVNGSATITTSAYSLPANTTAGVPTTQTDDCMLQVWLDLNALAAGDEFKLTLYERINAGTQRIAETWSFVGAQGSPIFVSPALIVGDGWDVVLVKVAGTDRAIPWSLRKAT